MGVTTTSTDRLCNLGRDDLAEMYDAAVEVVTCTRSLAEAGKNPVTAALDGAPVVEEWAHYPAATDIHDPSTHAQYYYHAHSAEERVPNEHGHFHTFLRWGRPGLTSSSSSRPEPAHETAQSEAVTHIVAISMDCYGSPFRLFTTNRWVTGESWHEADDVIQMLSRFSVDIAEPSRPLNRWLTALLRLFRPQIAELIRARDSHLAQRRGLRSVSDVYEDRTLHVITETHIDVLDQIRSIEALLSRGAP